MKIRWKLLILLLAISLAPLIAATVLYRVSTRRLGTHLARDMRDVLTQATRRHLQQMVDDYGRIVSQQKAALELAISVQAREVERRLAADPPVSPRLYFATDIDEGVRLPEGLSPSARHFRSGKPMNVTYDEQSYFIPKGVAREAVADDMARLSTMTGVYKLLHGSNPELVYWQYTSLESGCHNSYPGHGGYAPQYDPRKRPWYSEAKAAGRMTWMVGTPDVSTGTIPLTVSMPVYRPDGTFAGVTGIDVPISGLFEGLDLPEQWSDEAVSMVVGTGPPGGEFEGKLAIIASSSDRGRVGRWQESQGRKMLVSQDIEQFSALMQDAAACRSGVRQMRYDGRDSLWAYGACRKDDLTFPVIIVPYDRIVAQAVETEQYVLARIIQGLKVTGIILLGVVAVVAAVAFVSSRSVTKPVRQLAEAAEKLSGGDYETNVQIRTGDELQELGEIFNDMGPKLRESERMKRSLALAMEIQQHLLPQGPPKLPGFDIVGKSLYCDETGGDYYDFIDLVGLGGGKLGIAVGDVTGHGIGAALLMASARALLRSHAEGYGSDLGRLFEAINRYLVRDTGDARFMTLFYGVLDGETRSLWWTSGGHDPALWLRRSTGGIEELPNVGIPLGVLEDTTYSQAGPVVLQSGDIVLIGTDGIWEAQNAAGEMFGKQRLRELLTAYAEKSAEQIYAAVVEAVSRFIGAVPQADDITLVVIKSLPE